MRGLNPRQVRQAPVRQALFRFLCSLRRQHPRHRPRTIPRRPPGGAARRAGANCGGVPGVGVLPGGEPRGGAGADGQDQGDVAGVLSPAVGGEAAIREFSEDVRGIRKQAGSGEGGDSGLERLLLPPLPSLVPQGL